MPSAIVPEERNCVLNPTARFALGPTLPLQAGPQFHRKPKDDSLFQAAIADTESDRWAQRVIVRGHIKLRQELHREGKEEVAQPDDCAE